MAMLPLPRCSCRTFQVSSYNSQSNAVSEYGTSTVSGLLCVQKHVLLDEGGRRSEREEQEENARIEARSSLLQLHNALLPGRLYD